ncbi:MAG: hypothetical protein WCB31_02585 [Nitrososphaeraceae archaeon]
MSCIVSSSLIIFKQQQVIAYSQQQHHPSFTTTTTNSSEKELSNMLLNQMNQIVFKYLTNDTSSLDSTIPVSICILYNH